MEAVAHLSATELRAGLPEVQASPSDGGVLEDIVIRPSADQREHLERVRVTAEEGVPGDRWSWECWLKLDDGRSDPRVQISLINTRLAQLIAGTRERWALAGDNLYVDLDLSRENLPVGQRLALGGAILEVTDKVHTGCKKFIQRFGADACQFVNDEPGASLRLRGLYVKVIQEGEIAVGDVVRKV